MSKPGWMIDELAHAGEEHLDLDFVAGYDRKSQTDHSGDLEILLARGLGPESVVVDLGAGTGTFALAVAPHCRRVVAADISPAMLTYMRLQVERAGLDNVDIVHAGLLSYEHEGEPPGFVYSRNTLHHLPDFWKALALRRIAELLAPGGVLLLHDLVYSFEPGETSEVFERWLDGVVDDPEVGYTREDLETHIREECSTFSWLLEPIIERAGLRIEEVNHRPSRTYSAYICVKP
ncbi:MAG TPA: class I SAM-dependent methyltransferase [Thermomicrobiales bacterium]|nr:class I SAM-dependent methyltransferase [Thermomicrobiales bacterium]